MYSVGENFYYEIDDEEYEYFVIGDMIIKGKEYIVAENEEHEKVVFLYDDLEETVSKVEEEDEQEELLEFWENEFYGTSEENGLWDDEDLGSDFEEEEEDFVDIDELDDFDEEEEEDMYF